MHQPLTVIVRSRCARSFLRARRFGAHLPIQSRGALMLEKWSIRVRDRAQGHFDVFLKRLNIPESEILFILCILRILCITLSTVIIELFGTVDNPICWLNVMTRFLDIIEQTIIQSPEQGET